MGDGGKGSRQRPAQVDKETLDRNWEMIFGKKDKKKNENISPTGCSGQTEYNNGASCTCRDVCSREKT